MQLTGRRRRKARYINVCIFIPAFCHYGKFKFIVHYIYIYIYIYSENLRCRLFIYYTLRFSSNLYRIINKCFSFFRLLFIYLHQSVLTFVSLILIKISVLRMENKFGRPFGSIVIQMRKDLLPL